MLGILGESFFGAKLSPPLAAHLVGGGTSIATGLRASIPVECSPSVRDSHYSIEREMKIALVSTPFITVPPREYGGAELIVYELADGLVERGQDRKSTRLTYIHV